MRLSTFSRTASRFALSLPHATSERGGSIANSSFSHDGECNGETRKQSARSMAVQRGCASKTSHFLISKFKLESGKARVQKPACPQTIYAALCYQKSPSSHALFAALTNWRDSNSQP